MTEEKGKIKEAEQDRGAVAGHRLDRAIREEEESRNPEGRRGQGSGREPVLQVKAGDQAGAEERRQVVLKAAHGRKSHTIKFIESDKDGDGNGRAEKGRRGPPHQQQQQGEEDDPGNYALFNSKSP